MLEDKKNEDLSVADSDENSLDTSINSGSDAEDEKTTAENKRSAENAEEGVNTQDTVHPEEDEPIDVEALMAEFDKESNTRHFTGLPKYLVKGFLIAFTLYMFYVTLIATPAEQVRRASFLGLLIFIGFILFPAHKGQTQRINHVPWYDWLFAVLGGGSYFYFVINYEKIVAKAISIDTIDMVVALIGIVLLFELCRRAVGIPILVVAGCFIAYAFIKGYTLRRVLHQLFYTTNGIIGTPIGVCCTFIVLFIILAAFLEKTGVGAFFIDFANSLAGRFSGGPAKVAVISSALLGMCSGSSVANTVGSGSITIPVMKRTGYKPKFAAAVEATSSTGGQLMPPIMGAAAFLMAEMTATPYGRIAVAAIVPAFLYFTGVFLQVHFEAKKEGLSGLPREEIPRVFHVLAHRGYLFVPIAILIIMMCLGKTAAYSCCIAIAACIIVSFFSKETRLTPKSFLEALENGAKNTIGVALACAVAGNIVGVVTLTGLGQVLINMLMTIANNSLLLALMLTMIACIILGMGIPTTANYIIMATITAPIVIKMGVPVLAAHMFVFYFGIVADITPPVALAAYAGSAIARSNPLATGVQAFRLAITAFIVPYMFVLNPAMLFIDTTAIEVIRIIVTAFIGMMGVAAGMEGFFLYRLNIFERIISIAGGLLMIESHLLTDVGGLVLIAAVLGVQLFNKRRHNKQGGNPAEATA